MASFSGLRDKYDNFRTPAVQILVGGKEISKDECGFALSNIEVESTAGYEAGVARFSIYNAYDVLFHEFKTKEVQKYITIGSAVVINMGYGTEFTKVFQGFVSQVTFSYRQGDLPIIEVQAMDIKGIMMANTYARQIAAESYSEAVSQVLNQAFYQKLKGDKNVFSKISITDTPDKKQGGGKKETTDRTIEMVNESDYEFVVRAAKRYNYEFFQVLDTVYFRKAKSDKQSLMDIGPEDGMIAFEVSYDVTGLAGKVEVRNTDPAKGKLVKYAIKLDGKLSESGKAKGLVGKQNKIFIDPTASTQQEAEYRARYIRENMSYRYGTLEADTVGLPELVPGKFISVDGLGKTVSNKFYVKTVRHSMMTDDRIYRTHVTGIAEGLPAVSLPL
ncbi:MAG: hypothetical protein K6E19_02135 [Lachnospiraceae bacterium]|nr:hypothetical protein [Lachnospiraceae bacterium]